MSSPIPSESTNMDMKIIQLQQNLLDEDRYYPPIIVKQLHENNITAECMREFLALGSSHSSGHIGIAGGYTESSRALTVLAVANETQILFIQLGNARRKRGEHSASDRGLQILERELLCHPGCTVYAFNLGSLAMSLYFDHAIKMINGVDVQDVCAKASRSPLAAIEHAVGDKIALHKDNINATFKHSVWTSETGIRTTRHFALQAWIARYLRSIADMEEVFRAAPRINTRDKPSQEMEYLAQMVRGDQKVAAQTAPSTRHDFRTMSTRGKKAHLNSSQYTTRVQRSNNVRLTVRDAVTGAEYVTHARTVGLTGREARLVANSALDGREIISAVTEDNYRLTNADMQKEITILNALQGTAKLFTTPFLKYIFFPDEEIEWPEHPLSSSVAHSTILTSRPLNNSQQAAVEHMLSLDPNDSITMIQGPPGTGKTTVIATFVLSAIAAGFTGIWLVAQTNVAVKNIAEKLADSGFYDWRLLVSTDFHDGWHEHLYSKISKNIVQSAQFSSAIKQLGNCQVILCTLSMLSNPRINLFTHRIPINVLVVDEASQIALSDFIAPLSSISTLAKLSFIGDDKQLPPFGQDEEKTIESIFDKIHLQQSAIMLDIQYRMPPQIGDFISDAVYNGQLQSNPEHPITARTTACYFVDTDGIEKPSGNSYINPQECIAVQKIAFNLEAKGIQYRVITPYVPQRELLEQTLKKAGLRWQNRCFVVDSFQGNEDDYIIISLVRSEAIGFLTDLRRTNVMLSRCKKGMYICSSWNFLDGRGKDTLVGQMASYCGEKAWIGMDHLDGEY